MTSLFDQVTLDDGPKRPDESLFKFIERSNSEQMIQARSTLQLFLNELPKKHQQSFANKIRNGKDTDCEATIFEILVHSFLLRSGSQVIEVEPDIGGRKPDFLAETNDGQRFVVEASVLQDMSAEEATVYRIWDALNKIRPCKYYLHLRVTGTFDQTPSLKGLKRRFACWVKQIGETEPQPFEETINEVKILVRPIRPIGAGYMGPTISAAEPASARWVGPPADIRSKIKRKRKNLKYVEDPAILALKIPILHGNTDSMLSAFIGDERTFVNRNDGTFEGISRSDNGVFWHQDEPQNTKISGLLIFKSIEPWSIMHSQVEYWANPWAKLDFDGTKFQVEQWTLNLETKDFEKNTEAKALNNIFAGENN